MECEYIFGPKFGKACPLFNFSQEHDTDFEALALEYKQKICKGEPEKCRLREQYKSIERIHVEIKRVRID